jgi:hypothetical protein
MRRAEACQGIRMLRFVDVFGRLEASALSLLEATELLGLVVSPVVVKERWLTGPPWRPPRVRRRRAG